MTLQRGQVVWLDFNPQKGHEQAGRRPALIISPAAYNGVSNCVLVCPITSSTGAWPWKVALPADAEISGAVLVDQVKSVDVRARHIEPTSVVLPKEILDEVLARLATLTA